MLSPCVFSADASVSAVESLRSKGIKTIVMGFGSDFSPTSEMGRRGAETLNTMAVQGGAALQPVGEQLSRAVCLVRFEAAGSVTQASLEVSLDGTVLAPGSDSWGVTSEGVLFAGTACQRLQDATPSASVRVLVRVAGG